MMITGLELFAGNPEGDKLEQIKKTTISVAELQKEVAGDIYHVTAADFTKVQNQVYPERSRRAKLEQTYPDPPLLVEAKGKLLPNMESLKTAKYELMEANEADFADLMASYTTDFASFKATAEGYITKMQAEADKYTNKGNNIVNTAHVDDPKKWNSSNRIAMESTKDSEYYSIAFGYEKLIINLKLFLSSNSPDAITKNLADKAAERAAVKGDIVDSYEKIAGTPNLSKLVEQTQMTFKEKKIGTDRVQLQFFINEAYTGFKIDTEHVVSYEIRPAPANESGVFNAIIIDLLAKNGQHYLTKFALELGKVEETSQDSGEKWTNDASYKLSPQQNTDNKVSYNQKPE